MNILKQPYASRHRGFTLIEIVVVVAIVMILAAILLPVFNGARESARTATCSSNLKQIGFAIDQYVQDTGGFYPRTPSMSGNLKNCGWASLIYPRLKSVETLQCPSAEYGEFRPDCPETEVIPGAGFDGEAYYENWDGSYDLSGSGDFANVFSGRGGTVSLMRVRKPASRILAYDGNGSTAAFELTKYTKNQKLTNQSFARHNNGLNALFYDGHVKWISFDNIYDDKYWKPTP